MRKRGGTNCELTIDATSLLWFACYLCDVEPLRKQFPNMEWHFLGKSDRNNPMVRTLLSAANCCNLQTILSINFDSIIFTSNFFMWHLRISAISPCGLDGVAGTLLAFRLLGLVLFSKCCCRSAFKLSVKISRSVRPV